MKKTFSLLFSFIILFPSLLSLEHFFLHDHDSFHDYQVNNFHVPEYDCLTCDFISNTITDYSANDYYIFSIGNFEIKINSKYNFSLLPLSTTFNKNKAPPYFI